MITVIILTFNEEKHIERCIRSAIRVASQILLVDCFSTDRTKVIAQALGAKVVEHSWPGNQSAQLNWALENLPIGTPWVMRLDADEYLTDELAIEINAALPKMKNDISGIYLKRRVYFMRRWIRHGGYYPTILLRIWRTGHGLCEERWMDEHIKLTDGDTVLFDNDFVDDNLNHLDWWIAKHNGYANREAADLLNIRHGQRSMDSTGELTAESQEKRKRKMKENYYSRLPLFLRAFLYWKYRYFIKLGFLDGVEGFIFHFLQGLWYRFLVDAKIFQVERYARLRAARFGEVLDFGEVMKEAIKEVLGIEV
jgi:glycosyltransferase involved in cell wall biosynthesis